MSWWKTAKVGDKVVCVNDGWPNCGWSTYKKSPLTIGATYTISGFSDRATYSVFGSSTPISIIVDELPNPPPDDGFDLGWDARRFRPVQTKSTDTGMAILKSILNGARVSEDA